MDQNRTVTSPFHPRLRGLRPGLLAMAATLFTLAPVVAAASPLSGSPSATPPVGSSSVQGSEGMPPGLRSSDTRFIVMMIPHHEGAIAMADLALQRSRRPEIRDLAQRIRSTQSREIAQMRRWYRQWTGMEVPAWQGTGWGMGAGRGMGMGAGRGMGWGMPGFATSLEALRAAADFDRSFLEQMIAHHRMGVMMASHAQWGSIHPELRQLEETMVRMQSEEIEQMGRWYHLWYGSRSR